MKDLIPFDLKLATDPNFELIQIVGGKAVPAVFVGYDPGAGEASRVFVRRSDMVSAYAYGEDGRYGSSGSVCIFHRPKLKPKAKTKAKPKTKTVPLTAADIPLGAWVRFPGRPMEHLVVGRDLGLDLVCFGDKWQARDGFLRACGEISTNGGKTWTPMTKEVVE